MSQHEKKQDKVIPVETIPWTTWLEKQGTRNHNDTAKYLLSLAVGFVNGNATTNCVPIAFVKKGPATQALATRNIKVGELVIPLFFKKHQSMYVAADCTNRHPNAVTASVSWDSVVTEEERLVGIEGNGQHTVVLIVQLEFKLPCRDA